MNVLLSSWQANTSFIPVMGGRSSDKLFMISYAEHQKGCQGIWNEATRRQNMVTVSPCSRFLRKSADFRCSVDAGVVTFRKARSASGREGIWHVNTEHDSRDRFLIDWGDMIESTFPTFLFASKGSRSILNYAFLTKSLLAGAVNLKHHKVNCGYLRSSLEDVNNRFWPMHI